MYSTYFPESEASASASNEPGCKPQPSAKSTLTAEWYSPNTGLTCQSTTTFESSTAPSTPEQLTLFAADIPASHSALPESSSPKKIRVTSGRKCAASFEKHAPAGSLPRTFADMLTLVSTRWPHNWKMTASPSGRFLYQLAPSTPRTAASDSGLWATPNTMDHLPQRSPEALLRQATTTRKGRSRPANLREQVDPEVCRLWQTPVADDAVDRQHGKWNSRGEPKLSAEVKLWPTPCATMYKGGSNLIRKNGKSRINDRLDYAVEEGRSAASGQLNPTWVEWLMGFPAGWTELNPSATQLSLKSLSSSGEPSMPTSSSSD